MLSSSICHEKDTLILEFGREIWSDMMLSSSICQERDMMVSIHGWIRREYCNGEYHWLLWWGFDSSYKIATFNVTLHSVLKIICIICYHTAETKLPMGLLSSIFQWSCHAQEQELLCSSPACQGSCHSRASPPLSISDSTRTAPVPKDQAHGCRGKEEEEATIWSDHINTYKAIEAHTWQEAITVYTTSLLRLSHFTC